MRHTRAPALSVLRNIGSVEIHLHRIRRHEGRMATTTRLFLDPSWHTARKMPFCAYPLAVTGPNVACNIPISFPLLCPFQLRGQRASKTRSTQRFPPFRRDLTIQRPGSRGMDVVPYHRPCRYGSSPREHKPFALLLHRLACQYKPHCMRVPSAPGTSNSQTVLLCTSNGTTA